MKKLNLHIPHLHLSIARITRIVAWSLSALSVLLVGLLAWYNYTQWYQPLNDTSIPEDKLSQKREQLRVKDFDEARSKLMDKQTLGEKVTEDPFQ